MAAVATCPIDARPEAHVFPVLYPGYAPDDVSTCDCGAVTWKEHQIAKLRAAVEARLEREREKRRDLVAPGPDPDVCNAVVAGAVCGGRMGTPIQGRHTGLWIRRCSVCGATTHSSQAPVGLRNHPPMPVAPAMGPLFSSTIETVYVDRATPKRLARVAKQGGLFDRKRRAARDER